MKPIRRLAAIGLAAPCGCQPPPPVKGGFIGDLSSLASELAIDGHDGAPLAIEALDAGAGPRYELRLHENAHDGGRAGDAIDAAADEGDAFGVGPMTRIDAKALVADGTRRGLVLISPIANVDALRGIDDHDFRIAPPAGQGAEQLAQNLSTHPQLVLLVCSASDASLIAQQLHRLDPGLQLEVAAWAATRCACQRRVRPLRRQRQPLPPERRAGRPLRDAAPLMRRLT